MMSYLYIHLQPIFHWVIQTTLVCSVLAGLILLVKLIFRDKLPVRWHYLLWVTLLFRLMLPPLPDSLFNFNNVLPVNHLKTTILQSIPTQEIQTIPSIQEHIDVTTSIQGNVFEKNVPIKKKTPKNKSIPVEQIVILVWLTGVISITVLTIVANVQVFLYVKRQSLITDSDILRLFEQCKKRMLIKREIPLVASGKLSSPTLLGFIRPKILLSQTHKNMLNEHQFKFVFFHELAHLKRKDVLVNCIMNALLILHWFNPILWYSYYRMRQDQEIGCDALALTYLDEGQKIEYGHTIIKLLDIFEKRNSISSIAKMVGVKRNLKRRILMIKHFQKKSYRWSLLGAISIVALSAFSFVNAAQSSNIVTKKEDRVTNPLKSAVSLVNTDKTSNKSSTLYTPLKQKENFNNMTKEEILTKMINTVDNFETARGEFKINYGGSGDEYLIDYELSLNNNAGGFSKTTYKENGINKGRDVYYKDGTLWNLYEDTGLYKEARYPKLTKRGALTINNAFQVNKKGESLTEMRETPPAGDEMHSLFPYQAASYFLRDLNAWEIEKQNEELLGHNTLVIKGILNDEAKKLKQKANSFRFWIDKDTGILVKYETYNAAGNVVEYLYPNSLEINVPIDSKEFTPNLDRYKKAEMKRGPGILSGNIVDNEIPNELKAQWKDASNKPNETIVLHHKDKWYIYAKKGYYVDRIMVNGNEGTLLLSKDPVQKSAHRVKALTDGYQMDELKIVYE